MIQTILVYSALQTGVVDGAENPISGYYSNKFYEISKYYTLEGHEMSPNITVFSEIVWNKLSDEDKKLIIESFNESKKYFNEISGKKDEEFIKSLKESGVKITEVENPQEWRDAVKPLYEKYGAGFEDVISKIQNSK
ncbi:TRAP transporter substrate-binding protein DctP [Petroclostridium sp. X23]|uniref:TRAP transporter substrate-binding protein DctP n=1 Tax=Petroclostridium sp. X23 TaxID=3045146 RepID=UPI0024AE401A|nr:TRAP transporter substrate-binding protein DctP [Petroclostridium sp. X23]WHH57845.1 TRAP transporter substrate-binding protein DctP [Petroclostridium sp. X23]